MLQMGAGGVGALSKLLAGAGGSSKRGDTGGTSTSDQLRSGIDSPDVKALVDFGLSPDDACPAAS